MGKTLSKAGMRLNTRRQRSQVIARHQDRLITSSQAPVVLTSASGGVVPRVLEVDRTLLTLKLQKDELGMYQSRVETGQEKEMEILKQLLQNGKRESAQLLLKKKRFQQYLLNESEKQLTAILNQASKPLKFKNIKTEAENCINKNGEALKRIQMLLSLDDIEQILEEGPYGDEKHEEISKVLLIATTGERQRLDSGLDVELNHILAAIDEKENSAELVEEKTEDKREDENQQDVKEVATAEKESSNLIDFEAYVAGKYEEYKTKQTAVVNLPAISNNIPKTIPTETNSDSLVESSAAEETEGGIDADDEKSGRSSASASDSVTLVGVGSPEEVSSKLFPAVPDNSISEDVGNRSDVLQVTQTKPETT